MNNLFSEYQPVVVKEKSSIHDLFLWYNLILVITDKLKVMSTSFRSVKLFCIRTSDSLKCNKY